jgi:hypothetical protein
MMEWWIGDQLTGPPKELIFKYFLAPKLSSHEKRSQRITQIGQEGSSG